MKVGDLVEKMGASDRGQRAMILEMKTNTIGNTFLKVLKADGTITLWYRPIVKVIHESR